MITEWDAPYEEFVGEPQFFTEFMQAYPKQENRHGALREWWRIRPTLELHVKIMSALAILKQSEKWQNGFAPDARNFLRDRRWNDAEHCVAAAKEDKYDRWTREAIERGDVRAEDVL